MRAGLPKARMAARRASSAESPLARCSSSSSSRSERSSRSRSASLLFISALLGGRPHDPRHSFGHLLPLRFFDDELLSAFFSQPVILKLPVAIRSRFPFGDDPSSFLQAVEGRIERPVLHLEK